MQELQALSPRHYKIIELALAGLGPKKIAQMVGMQSQSISLVLRSPVAQAELARRRETRDKKVTEATVKDISRVKDILNAGAESAAESLVDLARTAESESVRRASAVDIIDRVLEKNPANGGAVVNITAENMQLLQVALKESEAVAGA